MPRYGWIVKKKDSKINNISINHWQYRKSLLTKLLICMSPDINITEFIANELEYVMVNKGFTIVDRQQLDKIRLEQNFQLSGQVDDNTAVSIGNFLPLYSTPLA